MRTTSTNVAATYVPTNTLAPCLTVAGRNSSREPNAASTIPTSLFSKEGGSSKSAVDGRWERMELGVYGLRITSRRSYSFLEMRKRSRRTARRCGNLEGAMVF